jgi:nitrilase
MKIALIQMSAGADKRRNIAKAVGLAERAIRSKAKFILFPEVFNYRGPLTGRNVLPSMAEAIPGESTFPFMNLAQKHKVSILIGSLYERSEASSKVYNTSVFIDKDGRLKAKYRKMNLFDAVVGGKVIHEARHFLAGRRPVTAQVKDFKIGLSVCYDLRFPPLYRDYARAGVQVLCVPSNFTYETGKAHWEVLLRGRAIENLCYVLAPNQTGTDARGVRAYGHSMVISPWGEILAEASGNREEIVCTDIDKQTIRQARKVLPGVVGKDSQLET